MSKVFIPEGRNNYKEIDADNLLYGIGEGSYTTLYFTDNTKITLSKLLKEVEQDLSNCGFLRINKNCIINTLYIKSYSLGKDSKVILKNNSEFTISRRKKEKFKEIVQSNYIHI